MTQEELDQVKSILKTLHDNTVKLAEWLQSQAELTEVSQCLCKSMESFHRARLTCPETVPVERDTPRFISPDFITAFEAAGIHPVAVSAQRTRTEQAQLENIRRREVTPDFRYDWTAPIWNDPPRPRSGGFVVSVPTLPDDEESD